MIRRLLASLSYIPRVRSAWLRGSTGICLSACWPRWPSVWLHGSSMGAPGRLGARVD